MKDIKTFIKLFLAAIILLIIVCLIGYISNIKRYDLVSNLKNKCNNVLLKVDINDNNISNNLIDSYKNISMSNLKNIEKRLDFIDSYTKNSKSLTEEQKSEFIKYIGNSLDNSINSEEQKNINVIPVPIFVR